MAENSGKYGPQRLEDAVTRVARGSLELPDGYRMPDSHGRKTSFSSTRKAVYRGRDIRVRTTYRIEIDGKPLTMHTYVLDDGTVHCHGLPNYSFPSALDLVRALIDAMPLAHVARDELGGHGGMHGHEGGTG
jgi:hypothetical protein